MGIPGLGRDLWRNRGCVIDVSIPHLVREHGKKLIVIDGFNFYGQYIYPRFDWINGAITDLVGEIRTFVEAFNRIGVKLVFFFVEGQLNAGLDWMGSETWFQRRSEFIDYRNSVFPALAQRRDLGRVMNERPYYFTPMHAQSVVISVLRHMPNCEVQLTYEGDRCDATAYFARSNEDCLAILAQDYVYLFYEGVPCHLSLSKLNLRSMKTVAYRPEVFAWYKNLEGYLFPFFIENAEVISRNQRETLKSICRTVSECGNDKTTRENIMKCLRGETLQEVFNVNVGDIEESENINCKELINQILRFKLGFDYLAVHGPLQKWELIKLRAQELYTSGYISNWIPFILMSKKFFNDCILEDFNEFPPSSFIYQPLRKKIYGVLFHEEPVKENIEDETNAPAVNLDSADMFLQPGALPIMSRKKYGVSVTEAPPNVKVVREWCETENGCPDDPVLVTPDLVDPQLHPGLLTLWTFDTITPEIQDMKWQLFANCISSQISSDLLKSLPPTLVAPTAVLHILYNNSPKFLDPWEVEAFIAQAVMLPKKQSIRIINVQDIDARVVKLIAIFIYGCHIIRLLSGACGCPIWESEICVHNFFDGKLLQSFYEEAKTRHSALHLCDEESLSNFQIMKQLIFAHN